MTLFRPERGSAEARTANIDVTARLIEESRGGKVYAGVPVNDDQAMRLSAVWGCVDLIAEIVSTLPFDEYRKTGPGGTPIEQPEPRLLADPGGDGYGFEVWARQVMTSWLLRGNVYGLIHALDDRAYPTTIEILHPDRIAYRRQGGRHQWFLDSEPIDAWPNGDALLWHVPAYSVPGSVMGLAPISYAAQTIGLGIATQKFGAQWFGDGAHPTAMLVGDDTISEEDAIALKKRIMSAMYDNREPLILGAGHRLEAVQVAPDESQFLETIKANADDVARFFFRRPPGEGGEITYANVEARSIDLLTYTINGWLVRLERALTRLRPRGRYIKANAAAMLRTDTKTRYEAHALALRSGLSSPDERRLLEDMPPIPGGAGAQYNWPPFSAASAATDSQQPEGGSDEES